MEVKCPRCGKSALFTPTNQFRPFCSERCKLIDLGQWAEEKYSVPVEPVTESDFEELMAEQENALAEGEEGSDDGSSQQGRLH